MGGGFRSSRESVPHATGRRRPRFESAAGVSDEEIEPLRLSSLPDSAMLRV